MPTPNYAWPLPEMDDPANVPADLKALGDAIDATVKSTMVANPPVGALLLWPTAVLPASLSLEFLFCQGQTVAQVDYPDLGDVLGVTAGMITIPDLRNRFPVGVGSDYAVGAKGGAKEVALTQPQLPSHTHPDNIAYAAVGAHDHSVVVNTAVVAAGSNYLPVIDSGPNWVGWPIGTALATIAAGRKDGVAGNIGNTQGGHSHTADVGVNGGHSHTKSGGVQAMTGGGAAHENRPPYVALNFIIRAR